jgi:adenylyltransferase/sulfurtransferase
MAEIDPLEVERYGRHLVLPEVGVEGQARLKDAAVLCVGAGGLGSPLALYLAAAGIGRLGLVDFDRVDLSNLQRQILYGTSDIGRPKLEAARDRLQDVNPHVRLELHAERLTAANARRILGRYDVIADGTDNFATRYLVNDASVLLGKPNVYGSIHRFEGQVSVFWPGRGPCYRCLFPEPPPPGLVPSCAEGGVLGVLPGIVGALQAAEALKLVLGAGSSLVGRLLLFDALAMSFRELEVPRDPACALCGDAPTQRDLVDYEALCGAAPAAPPAGPEVSVEELRRRLGGAPSPLLLDVRTPAERRMGSIPGSLHLPMDEVPQRWRELDSGRTTVVYCKAGSRSARVVEFLRSRGFADVLSLRGGIDAWRAGGSS